MNVELLYRPSYTLARLDLGPNEAVVAEAGAMVGMSPGIEIETTARGGLLQSLARTVLAGESFFVNRFAAGGKGGQLLLAPTLPGDLMMTTLEDESLLVQSGSFVAAQDEVEVDTKWGGAKTFFAREGLIMLRCSGHGDLLLSSFGAIHEIDLAQGETYSVDTGHLVAFAEQIGFQIRRVGGLKSTLLSGEGLVVDLTGPGRVLLQTRSEDTFLSWLIPKLPQQRSSD